MTEPYLIEIEDRDHLAELWRWCGVMDVKEKLSQVAVGARVPGFALAEAIIDREVAETRAAAVQRNLRAVAKAGIDITAVQSVGIEMQGGRVRLKVEMMDLADLAEESTDD